MFVARAGGRIRRLTESKGGPNAAGALDPAWSPDGRRVVFVMDSGLGRAPLAALYSIKVNGSGLTRLTAPTEAILASPTWSPDGQKVAYGHYAAGEETIQVVDLRGARRSRGLSQGSTQDRDPSWSPDGRFVVFARGSQDGSDLWVMRSDGSDAHKLLDDGRQPSWSPDGERIAFVSGRDRNGERCYDDGCVFNGEIYTVLATGADQRRLTRSRANDVQPSWSPDTRQIAFASGQGFSLSVYAMDRHGKCRYRLLKSRAEAANPSWQPGQGRAARPCAK